MNRESIINLFKNLKDETIKHSPEILTGLGIAGMITSTILAVKTTPKAIILLEDKKEEMDLEKLPAVEIIKTVWKPYIPSILLTISSTACLVGASSVNYKRNAALATAYNLSRTALNEYREKVIETIGEKKEKNIHDKINKDRIDNDPISNKKEIYISSNGETLCYDVISGRYFKSDIESIKKTVNELNKNMLSNMYISLSEFYDAIGLDHTKNSDELGWNINKEGLIEIDYGAQLADNGQPCIVIDYLVGPRYNFDIFG